ncbi:MAG: 4-vinyl reductase [Halobacteriota archaeon]|nr:4-vinyl reductase [Halobacteriota archaeon]
MAKTDVNKRIFDIYGDYAIFHPDLLIVNRKVSESIIGSLSKTIDYNIGKRIGKMVAEECLKLHVANPIITSFEIIEYSGWGKINIDFDNGIIRIYNSLISKYYIRHEGTSEDAVDDIIRGIIASIFEEIEGKECKVRETKCIAQGDEYCEFEVIFSGLSE